MKRTTKRLLAILLCCLARESLGGPGASDVVCAAPVSARTVAAGRCDSK